ncbi:MAG TPA: glycine zipper domain-containing protein [Gemmataceae bacterium]|nr:glycine zipper domain-containing protein [Gemmataceae bacterium]
MHPAFVTQVALPLRKLLPALLFAPAVFLTGCATNTETGALTGAGAGAVGGALVGAALHRPALGAAIGAGTGAVAGAAIGHAEDRKEERQQAQAVAWSVQSQRQGMTDIATMARQNVPDNIIVNQIRTSPVVYNLGAEHIDWLRTNGVSDVVIAEMQTTAMRAPQRVYVDGPVYQPGQVMVVEEPPPVSVGVVWGGGYRRRW